MSKHKRIQRTKSEPALVRGLVVAVLALLTSLGVGWAADVDAALVTGVIVAAIALAQSVWTRFAVTANAKVITRVTTDGQVVAGDAAVAATGTEVATQTANGTNRAYPVVGPVAVNPKLVTPA